MHNPTGSGNGLPVPQSSHTGYAGPNSHSSNSITNGSAVPSSQSVQQLSQAMNLQMGNGSGGGAGSAAQMSANAMMCVAHSQSAHQLGLHQQLQQRFAAAAAANNNYGKASPYNVSAYRCCAWPPVAIFKHFIAPHRTEWGACPARRSKIICKIIVLDDVSLWSRCLFV